MKILIDNGHGAETRGKRSPDGRLLEYRENRIIARGIVTALAARGLDAALLVPEENDIPPARALPPRQRLVPPPRQRPRHPHLHPQQRRRPWRPLALRPRLVRLHHPWRHPGRRPRHLPLRSRPPPPPRHAPAHRLHRRRPRPRERLLRPPPHPLSKRISGKPLHGQPLRLRLPPQRRRPAIPC